MVPPNLKQCASCEAQGICSMPDCLSHHCLRFGFCLLKPCFAINFPSDSTSRWTPLSRLADRLHSVRSGFAPPSFMSCLAHIFLERSQCLWKNSIFTPPLEPCVYKSPKSQVLLASLAMDILFLASKASPARWLSFLGPHVRPFSAANQVDLPHSIVFSFSPSKHTFQLGQETLKIRSRNCEKKATVEFPGLKGGWCC